MNRDSPGEEAGDEAEPTDTTTDRRSFLAVGGFGLTSAVGGLRPMNSQTVLDRPARDGDPSPRVATVAADSENEITTENARTGDTGWKPSTLIDGDVEGYTTRTSVKQGGTLELCVSAGGAYTIDLYRIGWYDGAGGRLVHSQDGGEPMTQPIAKYEGEYDLVQCDWEVTDVIDIERDWVSGLYYARLSLDDGSGVYAHPFVVRAAEPSAAMVMQLPLATMQAYNGWPSIHDGGKSFYGFASDGPQSAAVSHDRPYLEPFQHHLNYATHLIRWMEREGYSVEYVCDTDVHQDPELLQAYAVAASAGHDEYWSVNQYDAFMDARASGTNLAFLGGNICYWRVLYEDNDRVIVCHKVDEEDLFRNIGMHEARLKGLASFGYQPNGDFPSLTVDDDGLDHPYMQDTGFESEDEVVNVVGYEWSWIREESPDNLERFFHYEAGSQMYVQRDHDCDTVVFEVDSGATVFHSGTLAWNWRLDPEPTWDTEYSFPEALDRRPEIAEPDERLQRFQRNVFADLFPGQELAPVPTESPTATPTPSPTADTTATAEPDTEETPDGAMPGPGVLGALGSVGVAMYVLARRVGAMRSDDSDRRRF